jgi:hypothetical protein
MRQTDGHVGEANGLFLQALRDRVQRKRVTFGEERTIKNKVGEEMRLKRKNMHRKIVREI